MARIRLSEASLLSAGWRAGWLAGSLGKLGRLGKLGKLAKLASQPARRQQTAPNLNEPLGARKAPREAREKAALLGAARGRRAHE